MYWFVQDDPRASFEEPPMRTTQRDTRQSISEGPGTGQAPRIVAFHGSKGGTGVTTVAAEVAGALAGAGMDVVALDADLERGCLHYRLDAPSGTSTLTTDDIIPALDDLSGELLRDAIATCKCGARLVPSAGKEAAERPSAEQAFALVSTLASTFHNVVIDTRASMDPFTAGLLSASDLVVLVVTPELASLGGARRALAGLHRRGGGPPIEILVNRSMGSRDLVTRSDIESFLGLDVCAWLPEDGYRCRRLADECKLIASERSELARGLLALARSIFS